MNVEKETLGFLEALDRDPVMQDEMERALHDASDPLQAAVAFAVSRGFQVTAAGLDAAKQALGAASALSDSDLGTVVGGFARFANTTEEQLPNSNEPTFGSIARLSRTLLRW